MQKVSESFLEKFQPSIFRKNSKACVGVRQGKRHKKNKRGFKTKGEAEAWERDFRQQQRDLDIKFDKFAEIYAKIW